MRRGTALFATVFIGPPLMAAAPVDDQRYAAFGRHVETTKAAMMGDPARALRLADDALAIAEALPESPRKRVAVATAQWLDGEAYIGLNQIDRADPIIGAALVAAHRYASGSKLEGDLLRSRGAITATRGQAQEALSSFQQAYRVFVVANEVRSQAIALQDIGQIFEDGGDYERALGYYAQASETYSKDSALLLANYNNRAEVLRKLKRPGEAEAQYKAALREARLLASAVLEVRILCNLADVQAEQGEVVSAEHTIERAGRLATSGEAAGWRPFVLGTGARIAAANHDLPRAGALFDQMFAGVRLESTDMPYREFHQAASDVYARLGRSELALTHLRAFQRLDDSARDLTASTSAQLASARFDFANQNLRISTLKAKQLQQEVQLEHQHARIRSIAVVAFLTVVAAAFGFFAYALVTGRHARDRLRLVNRDLEQALKARTEFLAMTSHEIRTPLNGILGMTQVMLADGAINADIRRRLRLLHGAGETMSALVDDILDVAKMETGAIAIVEEDTDVAAMLGDVAALWSDQAAEKGVALDADIDALPFVVRVDPARLRQIVFNLLSNAVKFTSQGRIAVTGRIVERDGRDHLQIDVADTGIGIDPSLHALIFEPFQQGDASTTRQFGGTGLGLTICRKLAQAMGGDVSVASACGSGAVFTLSLPLAERVEAGATAVADRVPAATLAEAHLLLVDGNLLAMATLAAVLTAHVGTLTCASTVEEALAVLGNGQIAHVLIDAGIGGVEPVPGASLRSILVAAASAEIPASVLAASSSPLVPIEVIVDLAPTQLIVKPIAGSVLVARLRSVYHPAPLLAD